MVVVESPAINHPASFLEAQEDFTDSQLIAKCSFKRLEKEIILRTSPSDEQYRGRARTPRDDMSLFFEHVPQIEVLVTG